MYQLFKKTRVTVLAIFKTMQNPSITLLHGPFFSGFAFSFSTSGEGSKESLPSSASSPILFISTSSSGGVAEGITAIGR